MTDSHRLHGTAGDGADAPAGIDDDDCPAPRAIRRLNLNLLYPLDAILRAPTLTQAGMLIALSQPAMSLALRKLREHFADELVIYGSGGGATRRLTPLGEALLPRVSRLLRQADATLSPNRDFDPATARRTIRLTAPASLEMMYLSRVAAAMLRDGPRLHVELVPFAFDDAEALFDRGVDIALIPETMLDRSQPHRAMFGAGLTCLVAADHPTIGETMTIDQYREARHAALLPSQERLTMMGDALHPLTIARTVVARTSHYSALPNLIIGTDLVLTLNSWLAQYLAHHHPLRIVTVPFPAQSVMIFAQWPVSRQDDPMIRWALAHLLRMRGPLVAQAAISEADRYITKSDLRS